MAPEEEGGTARLNRSAYRKASQGADERRALNELDRHRFPPSAFMLPEGLLRGV
ncbi:MAG: hypothetical protein JXB05_10970 [Myxococcaceae bacterium]|nr:hypothetical protein [Myxococcaceae bacterium]